MWLEHSGPNDFRLFDSDPDEGQVGMSYDFESFDAAMRFAMSYDYESFDKVKIWKMQIRQIR